MIRLFHFSEEPGIDLFVPRAPLAHPEHEPLVWTVDEWHAPHFFFPRDCPRLNFWARPDSAAGAIERHLRGATRVSVIEAAWLERLRSTVLYRYELDPIAFEPVLEDGGVAGYYVSRSPVRPFGVQVLTDLPRHIAAAGVELRALDQGLVAYHLEIVSSTLEFSGMRLRNAADAHLVPTPV